MLNNKKLFAVLAIILFIILPNLITQVIAKEIPSYNIREIITGKIPDIHVEAIGSSMGNLALIIQVTSTRTDSFDIEFPAGTVFNLSSARNTSSTDKALAIQSFLMALNQTYRFPGGDRPVPPPKNTLSTFTDYVTIYALCLDVSLPPPDITTIFNLSIDSLESISRIANMLNAFDNFSKKMEQIDANIKENKILTDDETRYAAFIDWIEEPAQTNQTYLLKNGVKYKSRFHHFFPYSKDNLNCQKLQTFVPEIYRFAAQNVIWTMAPDDQDFTPAGVRDDINQALDFEDEEELNFAMYQTNMFLELLNLDRRLLVIDSLPVPISHDIYYQPLYITSWNGSGAGWANHMTPPNKTYKWQILEISYYLLSQTGGTFQAALLTNSDGSPGANLMDRRTVSFPAIPEGDFITVDISDENITIDDDFFVGLFQNEANNPEVIISTAINGRAHGFDNVYWSSDSSTLFFRATVKKIVPINIQSKNNRFPEKFVLHQIFPNPFNPTTNIKFDVPRASHVTIAIYNSIGQKIISLADKKFEAGSYAVIWNGTVFNGAAVSSGMYLVRMESGDFVDIKKLTLMR